MLNYKKTKKRPQKCIGIQPHVGTLKFLFSFEILHSISCFAFLPIKESHKNVFLTIRLTINVDPLTVSDLCFKLFLVDTFLVLGFMFKRETICPRILHCQARGQRDY